jgi:hypothetical protein
MFLDVIGLRGSHGTQTKLLLLMLPRRPHHPSLHLMIRAIKKVVQQIRTVVAGKVRGNGRRTGEKPMQGKGSQHFFGLTLTGFVRGFCCH